MHIILLRGLAREAGHWLEFPERLQAAINGCQLHFIDFPGCGKYYQQTALTSIADMTDHARKQVQISALVYSHSPIYVIGISMGGMVALDWAQRYPQELHGIALINSSAGNQPFWWRLRPRAWPMMMRLMFAAPDTRERLVLKVVSNQRADYPQRTQQWLEIQRQHPVSRATIITMLRTAAAFKPRHACSVRGLILASEGDHMVSVQASESLAQKFHWPIYKHPTAGHDLPMDAPDWVSEQLANWLKITPTAP